MQMTSKMEYDVQAQLHELWADCQKEGVGAGDWDDVRWLVVSRSGNVGTNFDIVVAPEQYRAEQIVRGKRGPQCRATAISTGEVIRILAAMLGKDKEAIWDKFEKEKAWGGASKRVKGLVEKGKG